MKTVRVVIAETWVQKWGQHVMEDGADSILSALKEAGYAIVPVEPTEEMCGAGAKYYHDNYRDGHAKEDTSMRYIWKEMLTSSQDQGRE